MNNPCDANLPSADSIVRMFETEMDRADPIRSSALTRLKLLTSVVASRAERERSDLTEQLGENHSEVRRWQAEATRYRQFALQLSTEINRAQVGGLTVDKNKWLLHGFVFDGALEGQPDLTVTLFDSTGRWLEAIAPVCTDCRGYFRFSYALPEDPSEPRKTRSFPRTLGKELFLQVSNRKKEILQRESSPAFVHFGEAEYREIILGTQNCSCSPPPSSAEVMRGETPSKNRSARQSRSAKKSQRSLPADPAS